MTGPGTTQQDERRFAVRIARGLVLSWQGDPLKTWEQANAAKQAIFDYTGEVSEVKEVLLHVVPVRWRS